MKTLDYIKLGAPFSLAFIISLLSQANKLPCCNDKVVKKLSDKELVMLSLAVRAEAHNRALPFEDMQTAVAGYLRTATEIDQVRIEALVDDLKD